MSNYLVVIAREGVPEATEFDEYPDALMFFDYAATQWTESYLCHVLAGPGRPVDATSALNSLRKRWAEEGSSDAQATIARLTRERDEARVQLESAKRLLMAKPAPILVTDPQGTLAELQSRLADRDARLKRIEELSHLRSGVSLELRAALYGWEAP